MVERDLRARDNISVAALLEWESSSESSIHLDCDQNSLRCRYMKSFWLVKQEPGDYSWSDFVSDKGTTWTGVRNFAARNNLRRMRKGDHVLFYHSGEDKAVVGIAKVARTAYRDATATDGDWSAVDLAPVKPLGKPVTLAEIKSTPRLQKIGLVRQSRLSVMPLGGKEFDLIVRMGR